MKKSAVLWDFHGTLADVRSIHHLLTARDYEGFYSASLSCPSFESNVLAVRHSHDAGYANLLFTGMPQTYEAGLRAWFLRNDVPIGVVRMRTPGDFRKDYVVKREMLLGILDDGYHIERAWDDSPRCIALWERQGIPTVHVPGWMPLVMTDRVDNSDRAS